MNDPIDKNGKTEAEFLRDYDVTKYFRPSVTVDGVLYRPLGEGRARILLIKRGGHPFLGCYAFPGGFVEKDEPCEVAAMRELKEETGITDVALRQLVVASTPDRDPRWRNITAVFAARVTDDVAALAGDDASDAKWFDVSIDGSRLDFSADGESFSAALDIKRDAFGKVDLNNTRITERGRTAFDHAKIIYLLLEEVGGDR